MSDEREAARDAAWEKYAHDTTFEAGDGDWLQEYDVTELVHEHWNECWDVAYAAAESAHHAQLLAVAEAVREQAADTCQETLEEKRRNDGEPSTAWSRGYYIGCADSRAAIRALDLSAIIRSALDGSVVSVGKAGE